MTQDQLNELQNNLSNNDAFLMYAAKLIHIWNKGSIENDTTYKLFDWKPLWKGHHKFISAIIKWWESKGYLTIKQHDAILKLVKEKYFDRLVIALEYEDSLVTDSLRDPLIFSESEFDNNCPNCDSGKGKIVHLKKVSSNDESNEFKCPECKHIIIYMKDEVSEPNEDNKLSEELYPF